MVPPTHLQINESKVMSAARDVGLKLTPYPLLIIEVALIYPSTQINVASHPNPENYLAG